MQRLIFRTAVLLFAALIFGSVASVLACGGDEASVYEVFLSPSDTRLSADGSDAAIVSVTVLDQNDVPAELGAQVQIFCVDDRGEAAGWLGGTESGLAIVTLDDIGFAQVMLRCDGDPSRASQLNCLGSYEGSTGAMLPVICAAAEALEQ